MYYHACILITMKVWHMPCGSVMTTVCETVLKCFSELSKSISSCFNWLPCDTSIKRYFGEVYSARIDQAHQSFSQQRSKIIGQRKKGCGRVKPELHWPLSLQVVVCSTEAKGAKEKERRAQDWTFPLNLIPLQGLRSYLRGHALQSPHSP